MFKAISFFTLILLTSLHVEDPMQKIKLHSEWDRLLSQFVNDKGLVNYEAWKQDAMILEQYLDFLGENFPEDNWSEDKQKAYWVNLYNASTIALVLEHYPISSLKVINDGKVWKRKFIAVGDRELSLDEIEHQILFKAFADPRLHFALNCAAISCPPLSRKALNKENIEAQLDSLSREFINDRNKNQLGKEKLILSKIFDWYRKDFSKEGGLINFLNRYTSNQIPEDAEIKFKSYNWTLNEQK